MGRDVNSVLICTDYIPPSGGGVEVVVENLARELADTGIQIILFSLGDGIDDLPEPLKGKNIEVVLADPIDLTRLVGLQSRISLNAPLKLSRTIDQYEPDLIHIHNRFFFTSFIAPIVNSLKPKGEVPVVLTLHLGRIDRIGGISSRFARLFEKTADRLLLMQADRIIAVSNAVADHAKTLNGSSDKITVIQNGVDIDKFTPNPENQGRSDPSILFVGRLVKNKGPDIFLQALPDLFAQHHRVAARIVGQGPMKDILQEQAKELGIENRVEFLGYVENMPETMKSADIFCRPSLSEGMPLTLLEAMSCGLPPVVSSVAGVPEVVTHGETGFLVDEPTPNAIADSLDTILSKPTLAERIGRNAREYVVENHDWHSRARDVLEIYEDCVAEYRGL